MVFLEVLFQCIVVQIVMGLPRVPPIADETPLVLVSAMLVQFVAVVESLPTEAAQWMALETCLRDIARLVVSMRHMIVQCLICEKLMLVCKHFFIPCTEITHLLVMCGSYVSVEIWPAQGGHVTRHIWTIVPEQKHSITDNIFVRITNANVLVCAADIGTSVGLEALLGVVGEYYKRGWCSTVWAVFVLV